MRTELTKLIAEYPIVTLLGPRQAGKTTLARSLVGYAYYNLESPEVREIAVNDPKGFLSQIKQKAIFDEIQRVPELLSYLQVIVDENRQNGQFILTGSHQLQLKEAITQSLAGRTAILQLLPLSMQELADDGREFKGFEEYVVQGFLPRVYDQQQRPYQAYSNYYQTYVERDVRLLINLKDASLFEKFMKLLAGRVGQLIDLNSLANDVGVDAKTIKHWLSILEASFIVYKLPPYFENFGKRVIKRSKYYFTELGLLAFLLGIERPEQVLRDPLVGNIFENLVVIEAVKTRLNQGYLPGLYFFRDSNHMEVDLLFEKNRQLVVAEIKSSATGNLALFKNINKIKKVTTDIAKSYLLYSGESRLLGSEVEALNFKEVFRIF